MAPGMMAWWVQPWIPWGFLWWCLWWFQLVTSGSQNMCCLHTEAHGLFFLQVRWIWCSEMFIIGSVTGKGVEYIKANLEQPVLDLPDAVKIIGNSFNIMQKNEEILEQSVIVPQSGPDHDFHAVGMVQSARSAQVNNPSHEESSSSDNPVASFNTERLPPRNGCSWGSKN